MYWCQYMVLNSLFLYINVSYHNGTLHKPLFVLLLLSSCDNRLGCWASFLPPVSTVATGAEGPRADGCNITLTLIRCWWGDAVIDLPSLPGPIGVDESFDEAFATDGGPIGEVIVTRSPSVTLVAAECTCWTVDERANATSTIFENIVTNSVALLENGYTPSS
jgi:hypothetical protein